jgi:NAD(P)H dehydrogenase (quinone)
MSKILVIYHSETGNTEKMAKAIAEGAKAPLKKVEEAKPRDLIEADAILIGSPTYFRQMSWKMKKFIDESIEVWQRLNGKVGAVFTSAGCLEDGEKCLKSLSEALECHGVKVVNSVVCVGTPSEGKLKECKELGKHMASLA